MESSLNETLLESIRTSRKDILLQCVGFCSLSYADKDGNNCLHLASLKGDLDMVQILLNYGANVNLKSNLNKIPLHIASLNGYSQIVELLLNYGSDPNALDILNMTPLHLCIENNHIEVVKILCKNKNIDLTIRDNFNRSCLDIARINKNQEIIKILGENNPQSCNNQFFDLKTNGNKTQVLPLPPDLEVRSGLAEFYKKKSFARPVNKSTKLSISNIYSNEPSSSTNNSESKFTDFNKTYEFNKKSKSHFKDSIKAFSNLNNEIKIDTDSDSDNEGNDSNKKKRLSMSPINLIDDTLNWMKNQSTSDLSNFELSLTDAGKLTLEYLNKNDPIVDEKRLLMKMISDFEKDEEKNSSKSQNDFLQIDNNQDKNFGTNISDNEIFDDDILFL